MRVNQPVINALPPRMAIRTAAFKRKSFNCYFRQDTLFPGTAGVSPAFVREDVIGRHAGETPAVPGKSVFEASRASRELLTTYSALMMSQPAFIPFPERSVKFTHVGVLQVLLDFAVSPSSSLWM